MKGCEHKYGVTLIETVVVVAIIVILVSTLISVATRIDNQGRERLAESTIAILTAALEQFSDYEYNYKNIDYAGFDFPLDCTGYQPGGKLGTTLTNALGLTVTISPSGHDPNYSGSEVLYLLLSKVPASRQALERIDSSLITCIGSDGRNMTITIDGKLYPLFRIIDPWRKTLLYDYYNENERNLVVRYNGRRNFPVIISAGPDGIFGNFDDITSR